MFPTGKKQLWSRLTQEEPKGAGWGPCAWKEVREDWLEGERERGRHVPCACSNVHEIFMFWAVIIFAYYCGQLLGPFCSCAQEMFSRENYNGLDS